MYSYTIAEYILYFLQTGNTQKAYNYHLLNAILFCEVKVPFEYNRCSLCRLIRLLSTWCRAAAFFSASGATPSQEIPTV
jgi:hypothetical protein